ncbi:MAG TPA: NAD(P)-binding domain-containing protein [Xanthobacteraceae bacterium]|nr:NAD(P)-binding domain-containing protein [Xanthobacteraceae bacterium]
MSASTQVAIIGAGPYGLSLAAHLRGRGIDFRIFGTPLYSWRAQMPKGMFLKSEGFASNLYDPDGSFTLERFCADKGLGYADYNHPVPLDTFCAYGLAFQQRFAPLLEDEAVVGLERTGETFRLGLDNGETLTAQKVVVAVGAGHFRFVPDALKALPAEYLSHSADHHDLSRFAGRDVIVVGGGASAIDLVAALDEAGANAHLVARRTALRWNTPAHRPAWKRWYPMSGLGGGWPNRFYENAPMLFRRLPDEMRTRIVRSWLGPAGAWPVRERVERAPLFLGHTLRSAQVRDGKVHLCVSGPGGDQQLSADHVIAATGFRVDLRALAFLEAGLRAQVRTLEDAPALSPDFESSVPGLHFVGVAAANTFGPVMRFLLGARYASRRISRHVANGAAA